MTSAYLKSIVTRFVDKKTILCECSDKFETTLCQSPTWLIPQAIGGFDLKKLEEEIPTKLRLLLRGSTDTDVRHFLHFICDPNTEEVPRSSTFWICGLCRSKRSKASPLSYSPMFGAGIAVSAASMLNSERSQASSIPLIVRVVSEDELDSTRDILTRTEDTFLAVRSSPKMTADSDAKTFPTDFQMHPFNEGAKNAASQQTNDAFYCNFGRYLERQLQTRLNRVSSRLMECSKDALIQAILTPQAKKQLGEHVWRSLDQMLRHGQQRLTFNISVQSETIKKNVWEAVQKEFCYSPEIMEEIRHWQDNQVADTRSSIYFWIVFENPLVQKCIGIILDFVAKKYVSEISDLLIETLQKYFIKEETVKSLHDELHHKIVSKLHELKIAAQPFGGDKMIQQSILNLEREMTNFFALLMTSSLLPKMKDITSIDKLMFDMIEQVHYRLLDTDFLCDQHWMKGVVTQYLQNIRTSDLVTFLSGSLPDRIRDKWAEERHDLDEAFDVQPVVEVMRQVFLESFLVRRSQPMTELNEIDITAFEIPRPFACNVALRTEMLMSLEHERLQPLLTVEMQPNKDQTDTLSWRIFRHRPQSDCKQLLGSENVFELTLSERLHLLMNIVDAVCYMHSQSITHGNICLESVLIKDDANGNKIAVLASAAVWPQRSQPSLFHAPELSDLAADVDCHGDLHVDIFAFGGLLWHLVRGSPSAPEGEDLEAWDLPLPDSPHGAAPLWELFRGCCARRPQDRPTAQKARESLETFAKGWTP